MATEERRPEAEAEDIVYKTKVVQFLGRSTPIVLQNDNGPCPLLAICNVLLLRNNINLSLDAAEVTLPKLLSLLAEKLIDSNSNVQDKDDGYVINQQQNIADAIDLLPRLGTGIDVNVQFRRINDFEFTRECAIFDLLDIGLCHGWIVDPQDVATSSAVGSKSYNALAGELVAFEARKSEVEHEKIRENDSVDFVAATTATLGVPSPSLSRGRSFDNCLYSLPEKKMKGKGDREEEEVLMMVLNMSRSDVSSPAGQSVLVDGHIPEGTELFDDHSSTTSEDSNIKQKVDDSEKSDPLDKIVPQECSVSNQCEEDVLQTEVVSVDNSSLLTSSSGVSALDQEIPAGSTYPSGLTGNANSEIVMPNEVPLVQSFDTLDRISVFNERAHLSEENLSSFLCGEYLLKSQVSEPQNKTGDSSTQYGLTSPVDSAVQNLSFQPSVNCRTNVIDSDVQNPSCQLSVNNGNELLAATKAVAGLGITEPIYEGEDCIHDSSLPKYDDQEPIYEGEIILCEQVHKDGGDSCSVDSNDKISEQQCHLIRNFLENTASQLTIYGLFCLQEGLKERELCVFFRNNHFSTMFKFNGELYLLVTDQGYINQPDLVWEKLNEVNGDTVFMTGNFKQFNADNQVNDSWNEQNAISSTADYLAALEGSVPPDSSLNSDLQLAIALQQQEFEQQPQHHNQQQQQQQQQQQTSQQSSTIGRLRLVTGPQVSRNTNAPSKSETKIKEKCSIM